METKQCPYCGERISATAVKCKYCGEWLDKGKAENHAMMFCPNCGERIEKTTTYCPNCHEAVKRNFSEETTTPNVNVNVYQSQNSTAESPIAFRLSKPKKALLPIEIERKWNWGAFFFSWIWGIFNGVYWPLIVFIPFVGWIAGLIIAIVLGVNGNKWAWANKSWKNIEHFQRVQHNWAIAVPISWAILLVLFILLFSLFAE